MCWQCHPKSSGCHRQENVRGNIPVRLTYGIKGGAQGSILHLKFADKVESTFVWPLSKHYEAALRACSGRRYHLKPELRVMKLQPVLGPKPQVAQPYLNLLLCVPAFLTTAPKSPGMHADAFQFVCCQLLSPGVNCVYAAGHERTPIPERYKPPMIKHPLVGQPLQSPHVATVPMALSHIWPSHIASSEPSHRSHRAQA